MKNMHRSARAHAVLALTARRASAGLIGLGLLVCSPVWSMDLKQAYEAAVVNDANIRASRAGAAAGRESLPQAQAQRLPSVNFSASRNYNDLESKSQDFLGRPTRAENQYYSDNQVLSVRQPLYRPLLNAQVRQAQARSDEADAALERDEQSLVVRVGEAYFDALLAQDQLLLTAAQKKTYGVQLEAAGRGLTAGSGTRTDVDEAQARLDLALAQELEALQNVDFTRRRLEVLTGQPVQTLVPLDVLRFRPHSPEPGSVQAWIERAEQSSPELQALRAQLQAAQQEIDKAQAGHKPTLDAVVQWSRSNSDSVTSVNSRFENKSIGLQLNVPLYSGGFVNSTVRQAVASRERVRETLEAATRDLGVRVHQEFRGMTEGTLRVAALEQAVRSAEQAVLSNQRSFLAGARTTVDVLNAEQQKTFAQRDLAQARYRYLVAQLRLQSLAGQDRQASIAQVSSALAP
ncbi:MAG: protease secretion system outer membrane protein [Hydrogenophaga sp.]|jgi:protease secretion system outer membrane protein